MTLTPEEKVAFGEKYYFGEDTGQDFKEAAKWFRSAARKGSENPSAQCYLGILYHNGWGVVQNNRTAVKWFKTSAEQGEACAQWYLGELYRDGIGVIQDPFEATDWFRRAAEQGDEESQNSLGEMLRSYPCVDEAGMIEKRQEAKRWFRLAAEQGQIEAQFNLGDMLSGNYEGLEKNYSEALKWFKSAADNGNDDARQKLKFCEDKLRLAQDTDGSVEILRKKAEGGDAEAQYNLAFKYRSGVGVEEDRSLSLNWLGKAAEHGHEKALEFLVRKSNLDEAEVARWCQEAANQGFSWAIFDLAGHYFHGNGVIEDRAKAVDLYGELAERDVSDDIQVAMAQYMLGQIAMITDPCPYSEMLMWFQKAALQGLDLAQRELARVYESGFGNIQQNYVEAYSWYELYFLCGGEDNFRFEDFSRARQKVRKALTPDEVKRAEEKAKALYENVSLDV